MSMTLRAATPAERLYSAKQSTQLEGQTGCIGHLQANMDSDGQEISRTWKDHRRYLADEEFPQEFEQVLASLDEQHSGFLSSRSAMETFCREHPESRFNDDFSFAFRADTAQYSYLIRLNPFQEDGSLFIYCYRRENLDRHMKHAEQGIRFITQHYEEKFRIEDGDMIRIRQWDGRTADRVCRYIDDCHLEVGTELYHICQFAEITARNGSSVIPLRNALPRTCYSKIPEKRAIVMLVRGLDGYRSASAIAKGRTSQKLVDEWNQELGVTKAQEAAMLAGSMLGWDTPAADPRNYDEQGQPIKPRNRDRGNAR